MSPTCLPRDDYTSRAKRTAARLGLSFFIDEEGALLSRRLWGPKQRVASHEELLLWKLLVGPLTEPLDALPEEFEAAIGWRIGACYVNSKDLAGLRTHTEFESCRDRGRILDRQVGRLRNVDVYVHTVIPRGFISVFPQRFEPLHWKPKTSELELEPSLEPEVLRAVKEGLVELLQGALEEPDDL